MEIIILIIVIIILAETTILLSKKHRTTRSGNRRIFVDTSVLIDGRILNIARTGFIDGNLIILKSVLKELQLLADGKDSEKRSRARSGLSNITELERVIEVSTEILDDGEGNKKVDDQLLKYAKEEKGLILTLDYNLIKVAEAEKIATLNINELALAVRTEFLPGAKIKLKITEKGSNRGQGVGHLSDGTMVVVEKASNKIGKDIIVEFVRFHETPAGKIIFARSAKR
ncbi:hypothetical protein IKG41_01800 [Candidatus Saccharibacteria bacterium]|nr:hypothetical protein [Candidatus Saccharibacteria bacterium]